MDNEIKVSIYCLSYNHAKYLTQTLEGVVSQKTNFNFELIIHDDASTDGSDQIILNYQKKYPNIIKPIIQKENQYSKGINISKEILFPLFKGKYVAICEGDDYWTNENKLQRQFDFLEQHPDYSACVHNTKILLDDEDINLNVNSIQYDTTLDIYKMIKTGANQYQTSSVMYRKELMVKENRPYFVEMINGVGDYPLSVYLAISGKVFYFKDVMSTYRISTKNSWTATVKNNKSKFLVVKEQAIAMLNEANAYSKYKYDNEFKKSILWQKYEATLLSSKSNYPLTDYFKVIQDEPIKTKVKIFLQLYVPILYSLLSNKRYKI